MTDATYEKVIPQHDSNAFILYLNQEAFQNAHIPPEQTYVPPHWHRSIEFSLVCKGEVILTINNQSRIIKENEFIFVNSSQIHTLEAKHPEEVEVLLVQISYDFLETIIPNIDSLYFDLYQESPAKKRLYEIFESFYEHTQHPQKHDELLINAHIYELMYLLLNHYLKEDIESDYELTKKRQHRVLDYIEKHYQEDLSLSSLAKVCHMNEEYFCRLFKKTFGINFKVYLTNYRLYRCFDDVVNSDKTVQDIALDHGFSSVKAFIIAFKKSYNMTPYQYRKYRKKV